VRKSILDGFRGRCAVLGRFGGGLFLAVSMRSGGGFRQNDLPTLHHATQGCYLINDAIHTLSKDTTPLKFVSSLTFIAR